MTKTELEALLDEKLAALKGDHTKEQFDALVNELRERFPTPAEITAASKSPGRVFAESAEIRGLVQTRGVRSSGVEVEVPGYTIKRGMRPFEAYMQAKAGEAISTDYARDRTLLPFVPPPTRRLSVRDLLPQVPIGTSDITYTRIDQLSDNATAVAELAEKPLSQIVASPITASSQVIATMIPVSRQAFEDVDGLAAWIDSTLAYFLGIEEEDQILNGDGSAPNLQGILTLGSIQTYNGATVGADQNVDIIRRAITKLELEYFNPTGIVLHPTDWEKIELLKDEQNQYLLMPQGGARFAGAATLWGRPVVSTPAMTAGTALVGAFDLGAQVHVYKTVTLRVTDSHSDWFRKNLLAVLAEVREVISIRFPKAFVKVTNLD